MPLFVMIGFDGPNGAALRDANRAGHLEHLDALEAEGKIAYAGPVRTDDDQSSVGAVIVFEAEDLPSAREIVDRDPFVRAGVFETLRVTPFKKAYPKA